MGFHCVTKTANLSSSWISQATVRLTLGVAACLFACSPAFCQELPPSNYPAVLNAVPADSLATITLNLDMSKDNPELQSMINGLLSHQAKGVPVSPQSVRFMLGMVLSKLHVPSSQVFAQNLDLNVALVVPSLDILSALGSGLGNKETGKSDKDYMGEFASMGTQFLSGLSIVIHDPMCSQISQELNKIPAIKNAWWHGAMYYPLSQFGATKSSKMIAPKDGNLDPALMLNGDYMVISAGLKSLYKFVNAIEGNGSLVETPQFAASSKNFDHATFFSLLATLPTFTGKAGRSFGLTIGAPAQGLQVRAFGPDLLSGKLLGNLDASKQLHSLLLQLPGGRMIQMAMNADLFGSKSDFKTPIVAAVYPDSPNKNGIPTSGNAVVIAAPTKDGKVSFFDRLHNMAEKFSQSKVGQYIKKISVEGADRAEALTAKGMTLFQKAIGSSDPKSPINLYKFANNKTLLMAEVNGKTILATSDELLEQAVKAVQAKYPASQEVSDRLIGMLSIEPLMYVSLMEGISEPGKPLVSPMMAQLLKSATGPISLSAYSNDGVQTFQLDAPINWSVLHQLIDKGVLNSKQ